MATQNILDSIFNSNQARQAERQARDEAIRLSMERAAHDPASSGIVYSEIHYTSDPGPDFTPRAWGWMS